MKLTHSSDLALRVLMYLGLKAPERTTVPELARCLGLSKDHLVKVVIRLSEAEYIIAIRGRGGGIELAKAPNDIIIGEVLRDLESNFDLVECMRSENDCILTPACALRGLLNEALDAFFDVLNKRTLADLIKNPLQLRSALNAQPLTLN